MSKEPFFIALFCFFVLWSSAQNRVQVTATNFENDRGTCLTCVFTSREAYEKAQPLLCRKTPIAQRTSQVLFENLPDGQYAIFLFHDANGNGKMDKNWLGIPKEGYGASNNKLPFAAAPRFDANKFSLVGQATLHLSVRLRNL
jgi:uncharacterized protein (DUF2141 family)